MWFILLSIVFMRFHPYHCINILFLFMAEFVFHHMDRSIVCPFVQWLWVDVPSCFQLLTIVNKAMMYICVRGFLWTLRFYVAWVIFRSKWLYIQLLGTARLFSKMLVPFYMPTNEWENSSCSLCAPALDSLSLLDTLIVV